jgi:anti-sigma B factor antagonist
MKKDASPSGPAPRQTRSNVLPLKGEIDLHVCPSVTALLNAMIDKKPERLVVDLSSVTYIDSSGLAALIAAMQGVEGYGGKFLLAGLQETIWHIFENLRLDQVFQVFPDVAAALAATDP